MESVSRCNEAGEGHLLGWDWRLLGSAGHPGEGITLCLAPERQEVQGRERSREERGATLGGGVDLELPVAPLGGFPGGSVVKNPPASAGELGSLPGSGRSPGGGNSHPLQCSCLEKPMDRGAWRATVHGVAKGWTGLSD